jgi:hypothetical protein
MEKLLNYFTILMFVMLFVACSSNTDTGNSTPATETAADSVGTETIWQTIQVKDEFGDVVAGKSIISARFEGVMSNSAARDELLIVVPQIEDSNSMYIRFYEYGRDVPTTTSENKFILVDVRFNSGETKTIELFMFNGILGDNDGKLLKLLTAQDKPVKIRVDFSRAYQHESTVYLFELDPTGLKEVIAKSNIVATAKK